MKTLAFLVLSLVLTPSLGLAAEWPWPVPNPAGPHRITGTLGEYRATPSIHFHAGVDITTATGGLSAGATVFAIVSGTIARVSGDKMRLTWSGGIVHYIHVVPGVVQGTYLNEGDSMGTIENRGVDSHLHLEQLTSNEKRIINTLVSPRLRNYSDQTKPVFESLNLLDAGQAGSVVIDVSSPTSARFLNLRAKIKDPQTPGSSNTGSFQVGYGMVGGDPFQIVTFPSIRQSYFDLDGNPTGASVISADPTYPPSIAYDTATASISSFTYFVNNSIETALPIDTRELGDGDYTICALAKGLEASAAYSSNCLLVTLDKSRPQMGLRRTDGASIQTGATNETAVVVTATDSYGLAKFVLSGPTTSTQTVSGTTADHTFSSLTANSTTPYVVAVHDLAGNLSSARFTTSRPRFSVENALPA